MLGRRRRDVAAGGNDERNALFSQPVGNGPDMLPLQMDVDDRDVEAALLDLGHCLLKALAGADDAVPEGVEKILEHHRDQRFVFDDQNIAFFGHRRAIKANGGKSKG